MPKYVVVKFPNEEKFKIPANIIAESRAKYYADHDAGGVQDRYQEEWDKVYKEELTIAMEDDFELTDWLWNNMDWEDVEEHAIPLGQKEKYNYKKHWMEVQEDEDNYEVIKE